MGMKLTNDRVLKLSHGKENMLDSVGEQLLSIRNNYFVKEHVMQYYMR
jgi:hypothetical protein